MVGKKKPEGFFRKVSKEKYVAAGILTFLILALGLTLGFIIDDHRYNLVDEINMEQDVKYMSLQMQYLYLNAFSAQDSCPMITASLKDSVKDLSDSLNEVVDFEEENGLVTDKRREVILRRYALDNLRYWLLATQSKQKCDMQIVPIIYFYSEECPSCPTQGTILSYFKSVFEEKVLVFPINVDMRKDETMVEMVMSQFNVTKVPTLIIDNKKYTGVVKKDQLDEIICQTLVDDEHCKSSDNLEENEE